MKKQFSWYFPISDDEIDFIWAHAILTVDANVLLDLYRYHESTRNSLISSLKEFDGRLWLSNQAAEEFIRNRNKVIVSSEKTFKQAKDGVEKIKGDFETTIAQLKGNRIIPAEIADNLFAIINPAIENALKEIDTSKCNYPKYLQNDPILEDLTQIFRDSIGKDFSKDELGKLKEEAEERKKNKIPPGYLDSDKDGDHPYGDFFLWRQILLHSKDKNTPLIFVTSERKDDWWERISGKTIGPRPELLKEACEFSGQKIIIYQTDRFLEFSSKRSGNKLDASAVEEIRAVDLQRSDVQNAVEIVEQQIIEASEILQEGFLIINLHRPIRNMTGSGYFNPYLKHKPTITASLKSSPIGLKKYKIKAGTGTNYDFNLHIISEYGESLPVGQYTLEYRAVCDSQKSNQITINDFAKIVGIPSDELLKQLNDAGINISDESDIISEGNKVTLLNYLRHYSH